MSDSPAPAYTELDGQIDDVFTTPLAPAPAPASPPTPPAPALPPLDPGDGVLEGLGDVRPATPEEVAEADGLAAGPSGFPGPGLQRSWKASKGFMTRGDVLQLIATQFAELEAQCQRLSSRSRRQQLLLIQLLKVVRAQYSTTRDRLEDMEARVSE